jgi:hypothetical protein
MTYVTPWGSTLEKGIYEIEVPLGIYLGEDYYRFINWENGSTETKRIVTLGDAPISITVFYRPAPPLVKYSRNTRHVSIRSASYEYTLNTKHYVKHVKIENPFRGTEFL